MFRQIIIITALLSMVTGCMTPVYLKDGEEFTLKSYYPKEDNEFRTYSSLLLALKERNWELSELDKKNNTFEARYCHKFAKECTKIKGSISNNWQVSYQFEDNPFDGKHVYRWVDNLQRSYLKYSSMSNEVLMDKIDDTVFWEPVKGMNKN